MAPKLTMHDIHVAMASAQWTVAYDAHRYADMYLDAARVYSDNTKTVLASERTKLPKSATRAAIALATELNVGAYVSEGLMQMLTHVFDGDRGMARRSLDLLWELVDAGHSAESAFKAMIARPDLVGE